MARSKCNFQLSLILIMLVLGLGLIKTYPVSAASSIPVDLETGYAYTYYDVTGDGRKDNLTVKAVSLDTYYTGDGYYNAVYLCVNGKGQYIKLKNMQMPFYSLKARLYIFDNASIRKEALERPPPPRIWALAWLLKEKRCFW